MDLSSAQVQRNKNEIKLCNYIFVPLVFSFGFPELVPGFLFLGAVKMVRQEDVPLILLSGTARGLVKVLPIIRHYYVVAPRQAGELSGSL